MEVWSKYMLMFCCPLVESFYQSTVWNYTEENFKESQVALDLLEIIKDKKKEKRKSNSCEMTFLSVNCSCGSIYLSTVPGDLLFTAR